MIRLILALWLVLPIAAGAAVREGDWTAHDHDVGGTRFSPLKDINPTNVGTLQVAWTYHMKPAGAERTLGTEATPLVIDGVMYAVTPYRQIVALDAQTGVQKWIWTAPQGDSPPMRGLAYWPGDGATPARLVFGTRIGKLMALDAADGEPSKGFGVDGSIDMRTPDVVNGLPGLAYGMSSPPTVYKDLVITGSRVQESPVKGPRGDVRAWDVRTGKLAWTFHTVPEQGEFGFDTWAPGSTDQRSGVNVWSLLTVDDKRGVVYLPVSAPTIDRYGGDRKGANLFSSSLVALDATTGKRLWHFQTVHHDIWDYDMPVAPTLVEIRRGGQTIPGVAAISKAGILFLLDRVTGKPVYQVTETPAPASDTPGEEAWPTQPMPASPPPLMRNGFDLQKDLVDLTPELKAACAKQIADGNLVGSVRFEPLKLNKWMIRFPGQGGGPDWGGGAFDPTTGLFVINLNQVGNVEALIKRPDGTMTFEAAGSGEYFQVTQQGEPMMCQQPPWGTLVAVNVNTGAVAWDVRLGVTDALPAGKQATGRPNIGGPTVTAGGLTFIGSTDDARLRAFETKTGKELWTVKLGAAAHNAPVSYRGTDGRQYISITSAGGSYLGSPATDDSIIAYALPTKP